MRLRWRASGLRLLQSPPVEILQQRIIRLVEIDQRGGRRRYDDARHNVDEEQPVPGQSLSRVAADGRADRGGNGCDQPAPRPASFFPAPGKSCWRLEAQVRTGVLKVPDCEVAASQFLDACQSTLFKPVLFNFAPPPPRERVPYVVDLAVRAFLAAYWVK
jgi:hypothetical protein